MAVTWSVRCATWGIASSLIAAVLFSHCLTSQTHLGLRIIEGALAVTLGASSLIAFHISSLRCSESHTLQSLLLSYKWHEGERLATPSIMAKANHMWKHPREAQEDLIRELTRRHAKTEYGHKNRLGEIRSLEDLRKVHPLTTYEHFKDYIQRLADGEEGVFLDEKPDRFGVTSGTTGVGKLIPFTDFYWAAGVFTRKLHRLAIHQASSRSSAVQKHCYIYTHCKPPLTKSGIPIAAYSFMSTNDPLRYIEYTSPHPAFTISDDCASTYVHMLFAIADSNLGQVRSFLSPQLYRALRCLETNWQVMLEDLSTGQINAKLPLDPDVRRSLRGYLRPDQGRVSQLRREFEKGFEGIAKRIWPHLVALEAVDIVGFRKKLQATYGKGALCSSGMFGCTEAGTFAINMWVDEEEPRYVLLPHACICEFIPENQIFGKDPESVFLDEVEVGGRYEVVLTTRSGLYRYRNGDVIQVAGFHESCPVIRMLYRTGEYLNVCQERTAMGLVTSAVNDTVKSWPGIELVDWACAESVLYDSSHSELFYVLFVEVDSGKGVLNISAEQRSKFDESLRRHHDQYEGCRDSRIIAPARVHLVRPGTFSELRDFIVSRTTASFNQYKMPRKLKSRESLQWMMERVFESSQ